MSRAVEYVLDAFGCVLRDMKPEERAEVFASITGRYCRHCGYERPEYGCHCENDE